MSHRLISRSPDLTRLRDEGYDLKIVDGHLVLGRVPYLDGAGQARHGTLASTLTLDGDRTARPDTHVAYFQGSEPCDRPGQPLASVINSACPGKELASGLRVDFMLSSKPPSGYGDYHAKMTTYVNLLMQHALALDPGATAQTFPVARNEGDGESPFAYVDTASSRAGVAAVASKVAGMRIAIVGVGGTGSYILDLVAKCPVGEIHLYDGAALRQHNVFRSPGAVGLDALEAAGNKAEHHARTYQQLHRGVRAHPYPVSTGNCPELATMDFVFVAIDDNDARGEIVQALRKHGVPFIDVGIGMQARRQDTGNETLAGSARTTLIDSDPARDHAARIPTRSHEVQNDYITNIQIAEINALNAALAVIRWKRFAGIYDDLERERHSVYDIDGNTITNEDHAPNNDAGNPA
ncbi:MAG: ThiF family adenylyltransferase [Actinomycetia bacterium]|nr:ThiF family adenylyltransferase [Actinomycetes bacterium]